jgi:hypothetical protein
VASGDVWTCEVVATDAVSTGSIASAGVTIAPRCSPAIDLGNGASFIGLGTNRTWSTTRTAAFWTHQYAANSQGAVFFNDETRGSVCPTWAIGPGSPGGTYSNQLVSTWHSNSTCGGATWHPPGLSNSLISSGWTHVAIVVNGGTSTWYINGTSVATYSTGTVTPYARFQDMWLGGSNGYSGTFEGKLDDLAWWNRALSASEVATVYTSGPGAVASTSLFGWWPMNE